MLLFLHILGFIVSLAILVKSSGFLVEVLARLAKLLKISEFAVGFIFIAVATSLPELGVGITSALEKVPLLTLGNVIGTAPVNLGLIIGIATLIAGGIRAQPKVRNKDLFHMILASIIPLVFLLDGEISRVEGMGLLVFFTIYMGHLYLSSEEYAKTTLVEARDHHSLALELGKFALGAIFMIGSADIMVKFSEAIVLDLKFPLALFGIIVVAFGTSLPELAFAIRASLKRAGAFVLGELMGSSAANATLILGITAMIHPIRINQENLNIYAVGIFFYLATLALFAIAVRTQYRISKLEGVALILLYIVFLLAQFVFL